MSIPIPVNVCRIPITLLISFWNLEATMAKLAVARQAFPAPSMNLTMKQVIPYAQAPSMKVTSPKRTILTPSKKSPVTIMFFLPVLFMYLALRGEIKTMEMEYPEKINPIICSGTPFLAASRGKKGAILE